MITINTMYEAYTEELNFKVNNLKKQLTPIESQVASLTKVLESNRSNINTYCSTRLDLILNYKSIISITAISFPDYAIYVDGRLLNVAALRMYVNRYFKARKALSTLNYNIKKYQKEVITFKLYKAILTKFNLKMIDKIVNHNYMFNLSPAFGGISVIRTHTKVKRVNWGASQKNKKAIIAKGGIPYLKADKEVTENYKGEEWLEYHPAINFYLHWHKTPNQLNKTNPYIGDYKYEPSRGKKSIVTKLQVVKNDRERALTLYTRTLNHE